MREPGSPGGRKGQARVEVVYFPKKARSVRRRTHEAAANDARTMEFRPDFVSEEELPTEPSAHPPAKKKGRKDTPTEELPALEEPRRKPSRTKSAERPRVTPREGHARKTSGGRKRLSVEIDTDPALRYHMQKLKDLFSGAAGAESLRSLTRRQLAEMAMFGHQLFESGRLDEARVVFEGLVALGSPDAFPHTMLGTVYLALGKQDRATALFEAALGIDPSDLAARVYRSEIRINAGQTKQALSELGKVISEGPKDDPFVERAVRLKQIVDDRARRKK